MNAAIASGLERVSLLQVCHTPLDTLIYENLLTGCSKITNMHGELFHPRSEASPEDNRRTQYIQIVGLLAVQRGC